MKLYDKENNLLVNEINEKEFYKKVRVVLQDESIKLLSYYKDKRDELEQENKIAFLFTTILMDAFKSPDNKLEDLCIGYGLEIRK